MAIHPFHLALPVHDLAAARSFYATMFFADPCGNALEFKAFRDMASL